MRELKNSILATHLTNLTNEEIWLYEESSGRGRLFEPKERKLPSVPTGSNDHFYIVDKETYEELLEKGRDLSDIAVMDKRFSGNGRRTKDHKERVFFQLHWGKNMEFFVGIASPNSYRYNKRVLCYS